MKNSKTPALAKFSRTVLSPMRSAWTPLRTNWRKLASSLKKPTRNTTRCERTALLEWCALLWCVLCVLPMNALASDRQLLKIKSKLNLTRFCMKHCATCLIKAGAWLPAVWTLLIPKRDYETKSRGLFALREAFWTHLPLRSTENLFFV